MLLSNKCVDNLEYITKSANNFHAFKNGLSLNGQKHPNSKLEDSDIPLIRRYLLDGESHGAIARRFNVPARSIYAIAKGKTWHHIP